MPTRVLTDTTIKSATQVRIKLYISMSCPLSYGYNMHIMQAKEEGLSTGIKFPSGRGPRCLLLAAGGHDGFGKISLFFYHLDF